MKTVLCIIVLFVAVKAQYNGNIDLFKRPIVHNEDSTISTVLSISVNIDGYETILPTINHEGEVLTIEQAIELYKRTGEHLGKYKTIEQAEKAAIYIHEQQERLYR